MNFVHSVYFVIVDFSNKIHHSYLICFSERLKLTIISASLIVLVSTKSESSFPQRTAMQLNFYSLSVCYI